MRSLPIEITWDAPNRSPAQVILSPGRTRRQSAHLPIRTRNLSESGRLLEIAGESRHLSLLTPHSVEKLFCVNRQYRRHGGAISKNKRCDDRTTLSRFVDIDKIEIHRANQGS